MYAHNRWQANFGLSDSVKMRTKKEEGTRCPSLFLSIWSILVCDVLCVLVKEYR